MSKEKIKSYRERLGHNQYQDPGITCSDDPITQQQFKELCDINQIVKAHTQGNTTHMVNTFSPSYGDFSEVPDFQTALMQVQEAQEAFMALDAGIRKEFDNSPQKLISFLEDPRNERRARELGLLNPLAEPNPVQNQQPPTEKVGVSP